MKNDDTQDWDDLWTVSEGELVTHIAGHFAEFGYMDPHHFLELRSFIVRGKAGKEHETIVENLVADYGKDWLRDIGEAVNILKNGDEFWEILSESLDLMVVGEEKNKLTLALLEAGGEHVFVMGRSSIGKSYLINQTLKVFPESWVLKRGGMSDKVMQYIDWEGEHRNKRIFYLQEFTSVSAEQDKQFRLLSDDDGGLTYSVTVRSKETGEFTEQVGRIRPIGFITSTTKVDVNDENLTRAWVITPTDDESQTGEIINRDNELAAFPWNRKDPTKMLDDLQRCFMLLDVKQWKDKNNRYLVAQPFLSLVNFPTKVARMRRDRSKIERLASIITIVNQYQRPSIRVNGTSFLVGSLSDLALAIDLTDKIFSETVTSMTERHFDVLAVIVGEYEKAITNHEEFFGVTAKAISLKTPNLSQKMVYKVCESLVELGYLTSEKGEGRGSPNIYGIKMLPEAKLAVDWTSAQDHFLKWIERLPDDIKKRLEEQTDQLINPTYPAVLRRNNSKPLVEIPDSVKQALDAPVLVRTKSKGSDSGTQPLEGFLEAETIISSQSEDKDLLTWVSLKPKNELFILSMREFKDFGEKALEKGLIEETEKAGQYRRVK